MEATFGALTEKKVEAKKMEETVVIDPPKIFESVADLPIKKVVAASIKINGLPVKMVEKPSEENQPEKEAVPAVRIRIRSGKSPTRTPEPPETPPISTAANVVDESPREKSSESDTSSSRASSLRKRRDPNRTLENLQSILKAEKMEGCNEEKKEEAEPPKPRKIPIPLVLITEPSNPSTPLATTPVTTAASICLWNKSSTSSDGEEEDEDEEYEDEDEYSSGDWTEGEDDEEYLSDEEEDEFSVSQTFSLKDHINLYPLATSSSNTSALVSEFSPDGDDDTFLTDARKEESRGRVDSLFAVPAPTFTCSVTYDGMLPGDEEEEEEWSDEVHSCEEGDDEDFRVLPIGRPGSSSLGAYMSTENITSEEEDYDGRTVGCTLKLVDKAARKDSEDDSDDSEYYDDEEEEEEYSDEEYWDEEIEYEDEEEYEYEDEEEEEEVLEEFVDDDDVSMRSVESSECEESVEEEVQELFVTPMKLMTESLVEEMIEEACIGELPEETLFALDGVEVEDYTGTKDIQMIPTFVRPLSEDVHEESASRFAADRKPATDFARKAVIQPTKLEKVQVGTKIDTKLAPSEEEKRKMREAEEEEKRRKEALERKRKEAESVKINIK
uniref:Uncharacterized protein n=1 Tax=Caenorhabditis japonica TaxID=281687 RepID=A0A8R1DKC9_CAEJA